MRIPLFLSFLFFTLEIQFDFRMENNKLISNMCISTNSSNIKCLDFLLDFESDKSFIISRKSDLSSFPINNSVTPYSIPSVQRVLICDALQTQMISTNLLPSYIYDPSQFILNAPNALNILNVFPDENVCPLNYNFQPIGFLGLGFYSQFIWYYLDNYKLPKNNIFTYQFITKDIGKILIGEDIYFRNKKVCYENNKSAIRNCVFDKYEFIGVLFESNFPGTQSEVYFYLKYDDIIIHETDENKRKFIQIFLNLNCSTYSSYFHSEEFLRFSCPKDVIDQQDFQIKFDNNITLYKYDLFMDDNNDYKKYVTAFKLSNVVIPNQRLIYLGIKTLQNYKLQFTSDTTEVFFEDIRLGKSWRVELLSLLYGVLIICILVAAQTYVLFYSKY